MNIKSPKAQFSLFIIISVIIVIGILIIFSLSSNKVEIFSDEKSSNKVKEFMESCLIQESKESINLLGAKGGWLYTTPKIYTNRNLPQEYNKRTQGLDFLEKQEMPYWYYYDDGNEEFVYEMGETIPYYDTESPYSIKNQIKRHIQENIENNCIKNFKTFENIYEITYDKENIEIEVKLEEEDIEIKLNLPLEINEINGESKEFIENFQIKTENKLYIPYLIAKDIVSSEAKNSFIEERILDFITPYQSVDTREGLPPFYDFRATYDFKPWDVQKVSQLTKDIISVNIGLIQFLNTDYETYELREGLENNKFAQSFLEIHNKDYLSENSETYLENPKIFERYKDYKINPTYESRIFPTYFSLSPSMGNIILLPRPQALLGFIPLFFTEYVAAYEITLPVVFEIKSNTPNDDFVFNVPIEANIKQNTPLRNNVVYNFSLESLELNDKQTLICDPTQFISKPVFINITDPIDFGKRKLDEPAKGIDGATVTFTCSNIANCFVGQTKSYNEYTQNNITELALKLPVGCENGKIEISKFNHKKLIINNVIPNTQNPIILGEFEMPSPKPLKVNINIKEAQESAFSVGSDLQDYERTFVIFENIENKDFVRVIEVNKTNQYNSTVDLIPGSYKIQGFLIYDKETLIPEEQLCFDGDCHTIEEIDLESWIKGGVEIESFDISQTMLISRDTITINLVNYGIPQTFGELQESAKLMGQTKSFSQEKLPYLD